MTTRTDQQSKRIISLILSVVLTLLCVLSLKNRKVVEAADNLVLLEKRHPGYWTWLFNNSPNVDTDGDGQGDVIVCLISKMFADEVSQDDYQILLHKIDTNDTRAVINFLDGTGIDINNSEYGYIDTNTWRLTDTIESAKDIKEYESSPNKEALNQITDVYEYLSLLKNYSFIISVMDDGAHMWNEHMQNIVAEYGLSGQFDFRNSYIAVVENGHSIFEQASEKAIEYSGILDGNKVYVKSAGYIAGYDSVISINDEDYSVKSRGINVVVLNNGEVIDSVSFDTHRFLTCKRKAN